ncbi:MAG: hypothetical protein EOO45_13725 [Flavobacterium sp.]|nr:MAG: hypothetical protein EOO45_13725 [Flavobacterium sp.]
MFNFFKPKKEDLILQYADGTKLHKLMRYSDGYKLMSADDNTDYKAGKFKPVRDFESFDDFWTFFISDAKWFLNYPQQGEVSYDTVNLAPNILSETNKVRISGNFTFSEYERLHQWDNFIYKNVKPDDFIQPCFNCRNNVHYNPRYPKYICGQCQSLLTDATGRPVEYFNTGWSGTGCKGYFAGTNQKEEYNSDTCYIADKSFTAEEARFGGIVIQAKE